MKVASLKGIFEMAAGFVLPQIIEEGFAKLPEQAKPIAVHFLAPLKSEFAALALKTTGTAIDDLAVETIYGEMAEYCAARGLPQYIEHADSFVQFTIE